MNAAGVLPENPCLRPLIPRESGGCPKAPTRVLQLVIRVNSPSTWLLPTGWPLPPGASAPGG